MKLFFKILFFLTFSTLVVVAQEKTESKENEAVENKEAKTEEVMKKDQDKEKFVDENGDGINDNQQRKGQKKKKGKTDEFIDNDGDGINDNRCQGMSWGKGKQKGYGKHSR